MAECNVCNLSFTNLCIFWFHYYSCLCVYDWVAANQALTSLQYLLLNKEACRNPINAYSDYHLQCKGHRAYVVKTTSSFQNHRVHWHFKAIVQCTFEAMFIYIYHVFIFYNTLIASVQFSVFRSNAGSIYTVMFDYSIHLVQPALFLTGNGCAKSVHSTSCVWQISNASEVHCMCLPSLGPGNLELIISFFRQMPQEHLMFYFSLITLIVMQNIYNGSCFSPKFFCLCSSKIKEPIVIQRTNILLL